MASAKKQFILWKNPLIVAAIISLSTHLVIYGGWKVGQRFGWWKHQQLPQWLQKVSQTLTKSSDPKYVPQLRNEVPLIFVDVDPQLNVQEPPKETKFYGAANTTAASKKQDDSRLPEIDGKQDKVIKTTENSKSKAQPLQPSPAPKENDSTEDSRPKEKEIAGELALAKPQEKKEDDKGQAENAARPRPRTLAEVKPLQGEKMRQQGGAKRLALEPSFDVKMTAFGNYDREFIAAVQQRWYELLEGRNTVSGKIVLEFRLIYDGRIEDLKVVENSTRNSMLELICKGAIGDPSPYRRWPTEMRREMKTDSREVRFTFYYE